MCMPTKNTGTRVNPLYVRAFQSRLKGLRNGAGISQGVVARVMGVALNTYQKYEARDGSLLPHQHIQAFLEAVDGGPEECYFLLTGKIRKHNSERAKPEKVRA
jgi:transcriptional regulator with XRE-family HTH domain